jgi:4-aminobutyrate aminotransferase
VTNNEQWLKRDEVVITKTLSRYFDIVAASGEGSWITDVDGNRYLDLACGIAVTSIGHCHPKVVEAVQQQAAKLMHVSVVTHHERNIELAERIAALVPYVEEPKVFFSNTGAEVIDGVMKLARKVTHKPGIVAFRGGFHGRTMGATSITTSAGKYRSGYEPLLSSVHFAPYCGAKSDATVALAQLDEILALQAPGENVGVMIVEPVLGEGGYIPANSEWLIGLRDRCDERGILLVFDEVQCGIARTGTMFAAEGYGVTPDVILFAKAIANGMPLAGIVAPARLMDQWPPSAHGSTFGGNPLSCAAALATLDVVEAENLTARSTEKGQWVLEELSSVSSADVVDVRGLGLMIGVELRDGETALRVQKQCFDNGVLILNCGVTGSVLRLIPPLNINDDDLRLGVDVLKTAMNGA